MTRLPPAMQPLWPAAKITHRAATRSVGRITRAAGRGGERAVPHSANATSAESVAAEPTHVRLHPGARGATIRRDAADGSPTGLKFWDEVRDLDVATRSVLEVENGRLIGDYAATVTPEGRLDMQTSPYFGIRAWNEHPIYLRPKLPEYDHINGTVLSLASPASGRNYYHSIMDALPRWGVLQEILPEIRPDRIVISHQTAWDRQLVAMMGLDEFELIEPTKHLSIRAERLLVPSLDNTRNLAPPWITRWLRSALPPSGATGMPTRLYVTRGTKPNSRRLTHEPALLPELEKLGFVRFDPGTATVQEQIDHFAAAEVVVAPHGAGLVNLNFAPEGVRVLELFAPRYLDPGYWSITDNIAESKYRYLVADPVEQDRPVRLMNRVQRDIDLLPTTVLAAVEELLAL